MSRLTARSPTAAVRLAHFSDIHVTARRLNWRPADWLTKRATGWLNLRWLGRRHEFRHADKVVAALLRDLRGRQPDRVVFSGDATCLGFEEEVARAATLVGAAGLCALPRVAG